MLVHRYRESEKLSSAKSRKACSWGQNVTCFRVKTGGAVVAPSRLKKVCSSKKVGDD